MSKRRAKELLTFNYKRLDISAWNIPGGSGKSQPIGGNKKYLKLQAC